MRTPWRLACFAGSEIWRVCMKASYKTLARSFGSGREAHRFEDNARP